MKTNLNLEVEYKDDTWYVSCDFFNNTKVVGKSKTDIILAFNNFLVNLKEAFKSI